MREKQNKLYRTSKIHILMLVGMNFYTFLISYFAVSDHVSKYDGMFLFPRSRNEGLPHCMIDGGD